MKVNPGGGGGVGEQDFTVLSQTDTFYVNPDNTTTPIVQITALSGLYQVAFTFNVSQDTYKADGAKNLANQRTAEVNALLGMDHVQGAYPQQDQGTDERLYNYLVFVVGTDDLSRTVDVPIRMDSLAGTAAVQAIDDAWQSILNLGPISAYTPA